LILRPLLKSVLLIKLEVSHHWSSLTQGTGVLLAPNVSSHTALEASVKSSADARRIGDAFFTTVASVSLMDRRRAT
jgi:hypothetical protein